ncbi:hypothetical protein [Rhodococcus sp. WY5]|nr:hypothetical protein [Rhodococcus sp. WY5]
MKPNAAFEPPTVVDTPLIVLFGSDNILGTAPPQLPVRRLAGVGRRVT